MRPKDPSLELDNFAKLSESQKLEHLVNFALLAPSSHNTQPWLFELEPNKILVQSNPRRALAYSDPTGREMHISIGTSIQNLLMSAEYFGYATQLSWILKGNSIVEITLAPATTKPEMRITIEAMLARHCNRNPFDDKPLDQEFLKWLQSKSGETTVNLITDDQKKKELTAIVGAALEAALDDPQFRLELAEWIKPSLNKYADGMPGYNIGMPWLVSMIFPTMLRKMKLGKVQRNMETKALNKSASFAVLSAGDDNVQSWIKTGMLFEEIFIKATEKGIELSVQAAPIEMREFYKDIQKILGISTRPQMFFRLGYCAKIPKASPRLSLEQVLIKG